MPPIGNTRNTWDVRLNDAVPMDLDVVLGVGTSELRLGSLSLRNLSVRGGAGETTVDLSGKPSRDLVARVESGVGELRLRVPRDAGVRITGVQDGIGDWQAEGFTKRAGDENAVYNAAYDTAQYKYVIHLLRGVGSIRVEQL
jgi:predicted membrane protein